jgi:dipeptidyl aminopeptidase/acylaminoacyl peptidase
MPRRLPSIPQRTAVLLTVAAAAVLLATNVQSAERRSITEKDLLAFVWIADPQMAPDGSRIAFVRVSVDRKNDQYDSSLWVAACDGREAPRRLTGGTRDHSPRWSPDGKRLAFVRTIEKDGRPEPPQIYVMSMIGGEARAVTDIPRGAASPAWSPDGSTIAFLSGATPDDLAEREKESANKEADGTESGRRKSDVRVITRAVYRANGVGGWGYVDPDRPSQIWTIAPTEDDGARGKPLRVTSGEFAASNHAWAPDGARIYFTSNRQREPYYLPSDSDLYAVSKDGGEPSRVATIDGSISAFAPSPDGTRIAFVGTLHGSPERSHSQSDLWVVDLPAGTPRNLTESYDFDINGAVSGDQRAPRGQHPAGPIWSADGRTLSIKVGRQGTAGLAAFDAQTGKPGNTSHSAPDRELMSYTANASADRIAAVISTPTQVGDLYVIDGATGGVQKLTTFNDELFAQLAMNEPEEFWYRSFDGRRIQGWILKPPSFDASKKYPLILQIHGGPHAAYGNTFTHEFQWIAARGYVVLYTNPRGSSNYGQEFGNSIQFAYPGDDFRDLMAGVDELLKRGYIDETRMGVTGGSGGGLLTNWVVTQTNRFKAAVSQRDISDWADFWYTADFTLFRPVWFRKAPFEDPEDFARRSPITYAAKIQTPLMFILGDEDWRTPPAAGGEQLFRALKYLKRPTVMVRFPGENHELSRSGRPWHRIERLQHIVGWFDKWLMGQDAGTYDTPVAR